jgi:hypothetical protein
MVMSLLCNVEGKTYMPAVEYTRPCSETCSTAVTRNFRRTPGAVRLELSQSEIHEIANLRWNRPGETIPVQAQFLKPSQITNFHRNWPFQHIVLKIEILQLKGVGQLCWDCTCERVRINTKIGQIFHISQLGRNRPIHVVLMQINLRQLVEGPNFCRDTTSQVIIVEVHGTQVLQKTDLGWNLTLQLVAV